MSIAKKLVQAIQSLYRQMLKLSRNITKKVMNWLLRSFMIIGRRGNFSRSGFVLPTVTMVILVVVLLTTAIVFRSFDRAKNAANVRVNERVMAAASPAINRAQAKINALLADPTLPRGTPTDQSLYQAMTINLSAYTLGDETPLRLVSEFNGQGGIQRALTTELDNLEALDTAWRFPVDTDNNGKFDSYNLYGLYFRNPTRNAQRSRSPLEARTPPMDNATAGNPCGSGTAAILVGNSGWYKTTDGNLKKSFFVFSVTVPITENLPVGNYETYKGQQGFAALEYQQDQSRVPLTNNAVVYEDDLEITPGAGIKLNGRIVTNSNLVIGQAATNVPVQLLQVSSINSCFYSEENGKVVVGGNVVVGGIDTNRTLGSVTVDLFKSGAEPAHPALEPTKATVTNNGIQTSYNSQAYAQRISDLVQRSVNPPPEVTERVTRTGVSLSKALEDYYKERTRKVPFAEVPTANADPLNSATTPADSGTNQMRAGLDAWIYPNDLATGVSNNSLTLRKDQPPATDPDKRGANEEKLGDRIIVGNGLPAKWWDPDSKKFVNFYDKIPQFVDGKNTQTTGWDGINKSPFRTRMTQVIPLSELGDTSRDGFWERKAADVPIQSLDGIGGLRVITGAGIYDPTSANYFLPRRNPPIADDFSTLENEADPGFVVVFPDSMPMWEDTDNDGIPDLPPDAIPAANTDRRGDLVMRATAVYHYRTSNYPNPPGSTYPTAGQADQRPIACISSYYNPSTSVTARNVTTLPNGAATPWQPTTELGVAAAGNGLSNNGITYGIPAENPSSIAGITRTAAGVFNTPAPQAPSVPGANWPAKLNYQANLIYPDGRFVNEALRAALTQIAAAKPLTLAHQSAIDTALCGLQIAAGTLVPSNTVIPHGTIYETTFLDARQVKGIETEAPATFLANPAPATPADYDLQLEQRQPLEIRATVINLNNLRQNPAGGVTGTSPVPGSEYLLPDSGIIYATRDDALLDLSAPGDSPPPTAAPLTAAVADQRTQTRKINSPVDFILDPTRRPSAIMLRNGSRLSRGATNTYKQEEKGLILATNLPVYVQADTVTAGNPGFNLHQNPDGTILEEFGTGQTLAGNPTWDNAFFYTSRTVAGREPNFACRNNQPGLPNCTTGDLWRPGTVLADAVTLLSDNFRFGFRNEGDYDLRKNVENLSNNLLLNGYDFNGNGATPAADIIQGEVALVRDLNGDGDQLDTIEQVFNLDLNGNGNQTDANVPENQVTITAARRFNGFFDNNYLTSADWFDPTDRYPKDFNIVAANNQGSSYVNNFVTPIQRRANFPEYVMEICRQPLVSQCGPQNWVVGIAANQALTAAQVLIQMPLPTAAQLLSGTTVSLALNPADQRYPRRVAFLRNAANQLILDASNRPTPIGINAAGNVALFPYGGAVPRSVNNALWFRTTSTPATPTGGVNYGNTNPLSYLQALAVTAPGIGTTQQPLLVPVLQIQTLTGVPTAGTTITSPTNNILTGPNSDANSQRWMQKPTATTTFNLVMASGDNPTRDTGFLGAPGIEVNGGMPNLPIFLENWSGVGAGAGTITRMSGSFIQFKRSAYATAPYTPILATTGSIFNYPNQPYRTTASGGFTPSAGAPARQWGYDVGLLPQLPDLFSLQVTTPAAGDPNEFYRELSRDDDWVQAMLCAAAKTNTEKTGKYDTYASNNSNSNKPTSDCKNLSDYNS
ncbi:hormogonium polysaccharide biosynthesis protein HpsA [Limnofasciculus baicalensis]|uniref:Hormogonium polysaccharide biosynthesis protein HpsA n=1 Tax=Limnofasciculus baicalensis BBK-W-15 TaxID=2699891 RepID=A0AAE3GVB0_9CYAN|nr:hormogonium polysaccharide biosynthesis protein HpsA [Limnofasciculus baicalensis]MCP2730538.1 hormogonium polysaccharide biosynthesis protein HpsA [Limnofasciculus baicalensis BBK-W-15]